MKHSRKGIHLCFFILKTYLKDDEVKDEKKEHASSCRSVSGIVSHRIAVAKTGEKRGWDSTDCG